MENNFTLQSDSQGFSFGVGLTSLRPETDPSIEFETKHGDPHDELPNISMPLISPVASRSGSPGLKYCNYEKFCEP